MNAAWLRETRSPLGRQIRLLQARRIHRTSRALASGWKQPVGGPRDFTVRAQRLEQTCRQQRVPILAALPLRHPDRHPRGIDIVHLQVQHFTQAQARGIRRHEHRPVFLIRRVRQQPLHLLAAEHYRQLPRLDTAASGIVSERHA